MVLVIDDDPLFSLVVRRALEGYPHRLCTSPDCRSGVEAVVEKKPNLVLLDNVLPDGLGIDLLRKIHELAPDVPVLFITARGSGGTVIEAIKHSAFDYMSKPVELPKLRSAIARALALRSISLADVVTGADVEAFRSNLAPDTLIGECPAMQSVYKAIGKVATQDVTVLIRGEHGAGKNAVAREIHRHSPRAEGPLITLHCRGLDELRLDEELFGRVGADDATISVGRIEQAEGGVLVLEEVGALSATLQVKLLRAVRDGRYEPIGAKQTKPVGCRFIAVSSEDLEAKTRANAFRSDLFYTLSSFVIVLPPLRQRHGDLPLLVEQTLKKLSPIAKSYGVEHPVVSDEAMRTLIAHTWPGNIDELESVLKRALVDQKGNVLLASDLLGVSSGPVLALSEQEASSRMLTDWSAFAELRIDAGTDTLHADAIAETEKKLFTLVLRHTKGNQARAARYLGITRANLRKKLRNYEMAPKPSEV